MGICSAGGQEDGASGDGRSERGGGWRTLVEEDDPCGTGWQGFYL